MFKSGIIKKLFIAFTILFLLKSSAILSQGRVDGFYKGKGNIELAFGAGAAFVLSGRNIGQGPIINIGFVLKND